MKVLCSGELHTLPIETQECLDCAIKHEGKQPCGYGYRLLKSMWNMFENDSRRSEIHVTDITSCLLKSYWDKTKPEPMFVHEYLPLWLGTAFHSALDIQDDIVESEIPVQELDIIGRVDAVYDRHIEDAKTTRWMKPSKLPYGSHDQQINIYRTLLAEHGNKRDRMQIQMIDLSGPSKCRKCQITMRKIDGVVQCPSCGHEPFDGHLGATLIEIQPSGGYKDLIKERVEILQGALDSNTPPKAEPGFMCYYCPHPCEYNNKSA